MCGLLAGASLNVEGKVPINFRDGAIVERLRNAATAGPGAPIAHDYLNPLLLAAADEIERLRAAHDHMMALAGKVSVGPSYADITKGAKLVSEMGALHGLETDAMRKRYEHVQPVVKPAGDPCDNG